MAGSGFIPAGHESARRSSIDRRGRDRSRVPLAVLAGLTVVAPQLIGGGPVWAVATIAVLSSAACIVVLATRGDRAPSPFSERSVRLVMLALWLGVLWTVFQLIPIWPLDLLGWLSPSLREELASLAVGDLAPPSRAALSWDPGSTEIELAQALAAANAFAASAYMVASRGLSGVATALRWAIAGLLVVYAFHLLASPERVFGLYVIREAGNNIGPLLNPNHLGGVLAAGIPLHLAAGHGATGWRRHALFLVAAALAVGAVSTGSRGASLLALMVPVVFGAWLWLRGEHRDGEAERAVARGSAATAALAGAVGLAWVLLLSSRQPPEGPSKLALIGDALAFSLTVPWFGVGRGAFSVAFVREAGEVSRFTHPENLVAQLVAEWGLPVALVFLGAILLAFGRAVRRARTPQEIAVAVTVGALLLHNLVDFSLEMAGVQTLFAVALGGLVTEVAHLRRPGSGRSNPTKGWRRAVLASALVGLVGVGLWFPLRPGMDTWGWRTSLETQLRAGRADAFRATLVGAVSRHPLEPSFALLAGAAGRQFGGLDTLAWLNRAMRLAPGWASPHEEAARWLWSQGRFEQAALELREAASRDPELAVRAGCELLSGGAPRGLETRVIPTGRYRVRVLERLAACLDDRGRDTAALDEALVSVDVSHVDASRRIARRLARRGDVDGAVAFLRDALDDDPGPRARGRLTMTLSDVLAKGGDVDEALRVLEEPSPAFAAEPGLHERRARLLAASGKAPGMRDAIADLRALSRGDREALARAMGLLARLESGLGNHGRAATAWEEAYVFGRDTEALEAALAEAQRGDLPGKVRAVRGRLCRLGRDHHCSRNGTGVPNAADLLGNEVHDEGHAATR